MLCAANACDCALRRGSYGKVHEANWLGWPIAIKTLDIRVDDLGISQVCCAAAF